MQDASHLFLILGRSVAVYLCIVLLLRLFGKKELAQLSVVDLVFILLISNSVQNAMVGSDSSLEGGIVAAIGLFITNAVFKFVMRKSASLSNLIQGEPVMLIYQGRLKKANLGRVQMSEQELEAAIREHGVKSISDVDLAVFEVDGNVSVLSHNYTKQTSRKRHSHKLITKNLS
jgi:uncharacterized membrane protein YcaP (DUF421 family)